VKYTPHEYQRKAIRLMIKQACAGLLLDPGLGKTSVSLASFMLLREQGFVRGMLVVAPLRAVYNVWPTEVKKWDEFRAMSVGILHGSEKADVLKEEHDIYVINPEGIPWLVEILLKMRPEAWPFDMLLVDESTKFKDSQTARFKWLRKVLNQFKRRYILTGTLTPNGLLDLFGQVFILDLGHALGRFISHYKNEFFYPSGYGGYTWEPRPLANHDIGKRIGPLVLRMQAEDYLELPELVQRMVWLDMPPAARKTYKELENTFITLVGEDTVIAPSAAAAGVKCRQVLNGAVYTNAAHDWALVHDVKLKALQDLVEELSGKPLLVLYEFQHDKERVMEAFPHCQMLGGQSMKKDGIVIDGFNKGTIKMVLGHPASMGHALNLQGECSHVCWFGLTWNFEHYDQAIRRVWRQGNKSDRVVIHHLCINDSLDGEVAKTLSRKNKTQADFLRQVQFLRGRNSVPH